MPRNPAPCHPDHSMPAWYDPAKITLSVGKHEFLRLA
jgi:hypothetical protein